MAVVLKLVEVNSSGSWTAQLSTIPDGSSQPGGDASACGAANATTPTTGTDKPTPRTNARRETVLLKISAKGSVLSGSRCQASALHR
ncbi:hypothetical protein L843_2802 [Mycobacterium intracellulare MIN_061107_1834]|nr:hypothetical protein L843_2802 [Mycobacterium intracellulare MIN_061107_1834]